jgi:hypothetical protein
MSETKHSEDLRKRVGQILGRELLPTDGANVASFAEFTATDVAEILEIGKVGSVAAIGYILFRMKVDIALQTAVTYYSYVIQQGYPLDDALNEASRQSRGTPRPGSPKGAA